MKKTTLFKTRVGGEYYFYTKTFPIDPLTRVHQFKGKPLRTRQMAETVGYLYDREFYAGRLNIGAVTSF